FEDLGVFLLRLRVLFDQVPLVDRNDQTFGRLVHVPGDVGVLRQDPLRGVDEQHGDVGALNCPNRAQHAELFDAGPDATPATDTGGVDQQDGLAVADDLGVDRIPCGASFIAHDGSLPADQ